MSFIRFASLSVDCKLPWGRGGPFSSLCSILNTHAVKVFNVKIFNEWMVKGELKKDKAAKRMKGLLCGRG